MADMAPDDRTQTPNNGGVPNMGAGPQFQATPNPLYPQAPQPPAVAAPPRPMPPQPGQQPMQPGGFKNPGVPAGQPGPGAADSDTPDSRDDIWVERAKQAIAQSQNDPYRQVQLLQHLNKEYLKERFNRDVQERS